MTSGEDPSSKWALVLYGYEVTEAGKTAGLVVVGGECPTVGPAGGDISKVAAIRP